MGVLVTRWRNPESREGSENEWSVLADDFELFCSGPPEIKQWRLHSSCFGRNCICDETREKWNLPTTGDKPRQSSGRLEKLCRRILSPSRRGQCASACRR